MSKISLHLQSCPTWAPQFIERSGVEWIKWIDPPEIDPGWGVKVIGRFYMPDGESNALIWRGRAGAQEWFNWILPMCASRPYLHAVEAPNEPQPMSDASFRARLNEFTVELARLMHAAGLRLVGMNWGVGWPDVDHAPEMGQGVQACDYLGLHEYSAPHMWDTVGYHCLRYRRTVAELEAAGFTVPPIIIGECGIDGGVIGQPRTGWRTHTENFADYLDQLAWYSGELDADNGAAATIFTVCDWDWPGFRIDETQAMPLADWIASDEPPPPPPPPERARGIDVSQWQGEIDWRAVADSGVEFAFMRATVGLRTDPCFAANWQGAGDVGLLRGVYHYLEPDTTGQAKHFVSTVGERVPELGYWGDLEQAGLTADKCGAFLEAVDNRLGQPCNVYTRKSYFDRFGTPEWVGDRLLWVADWTGYLEPALPNAWSEWEFRQTTSDGAVPGIVGRVDLDVYAGTPKQLHSAYGNGEEEPYMDVKVFDVTGAERDWDWLTATYGDITIQKPDAKSYFKITEIHERHDDSAFIARVLNADGSPKVNKTVLFYWPDAPAAKGSGWLEQGVGGTTNENGDVAFGMGSGAWYAPPDGGPHKSWLFGENVSEMLEGIGMLLGPAGPTSHNHVNATWQYVEDDDPVDPEPEGDLADVVEQLTRIADSLEKMASVYK